MKLARNDYRAYGILLVPAASPAKRLTNAFADPGHAELFGAGQAQQRYPQESVEVIVIRTATREAVRHSVIEPKENS